jgi:hypothetical protein
LPNKNVIDYNITLMSDREEKVGEKTLSLLDLNNLVYLPCTETTLSVKRQQRRYYAQKNTYNGGTDTIVYQFHGQQFVDFTKSYLQLNFIFQGANNVTFGEDGTILNIFREVRVLASNEKEIARTQRHNLLMYHLNKQKLGYWAVPSLLPSIGNGESLIPATVYQFCIPMRMISPFFDTPQLCPPQIFDNLRIEIDLENLVIPFVVAEDETGPTSYTVQKPEAVFDSFLLNDNTMSIISRQSPLIYEYMSYFHTESTLSSDATFVETPFTQPLANAVEAVTLVRDSDALIEPLADKLRTIQPSATDYYFYRWGEQMLPQQQLTGIQQGYAQLLYVNKKLERNNDDNFAVSYESFTTPAAVGGGTLNAYVAQLRRSPLEESSGLEISNKTNLMYVANFEVTASRLIDFYVQHSARVVIRSGVLDVKK